MSAKTDRDWNEWGARDAYFGVLGAPQFHAASIDQHRDAFFATGETAVQRILDGMQASFGPGGHARALDFGCGVGRLTLPLARRFEHVVAVDVASTMRKAAMENALTAGYGNISFHESTTPLLGNPDRFDFILSCIVLQHIPVPDGMTILDNLLRLLAPNGRFWLEFSVSRFDSPLSRAVYWMSNNLAPVRYVSNMRHGLRWDMPSVQMNEYSLPSILRLCSSHGLHDLGVRTEFHGRVLTVALSGRQGQRLPA